MVSVRKHWFVFLIELLPFALMALFPLLLPILLSVLVTAAGTPGVDMTAVTFSNRWYRLGVGLAWLILWIGAFNRFTAYFLNRWIITNTRVVSIHQYGFFDRQVSSFLLVKVQDVTTTVGGIFATLLNYGTVRAETAGEAAACFKMTGIPDPTGIRDLIMREIADAHDAAARPGQSSTSV